MSLTSLHTKPKESCLRGTAKALKFKYIVKKISVQHKHSLIIKFLL
jgi:hypothetical protein